MRTTAFRMTENDVKAVREKQEELETMIQAANRKGEAKDRGKDVSDESEVVDIECTVIIEKF